MKLKVKFCAEDLHHTYCRYFRMNLLYWWSIFDGNNIHRTVIYTDTIIQKDLHINISCIMIIYPISSNLCKKISLQYYRLYNFPSFRSSYWRCIFKEGVLGIFAKFTGKHSQHSLFLIKLQAEITASDLYCVFSWRFLVYFSSTEKWYEKREIPWWSSNIYFFAWVSICLTSKISK